MYKRYPRKLKKKLSKSLAGKVLMGCKTGKIDITKTLDEIFKKKVREMFMDGNNYFPFESDDITYKWEINGKEQ